MRILDAMVEGYDRAKAVIVRVGSAVARADAQLSQMTDEIARMRPLADSLGEPVPELSSLEAQVTAISAEIASDPLSVPDDSAAEILPALERVRSQLAGLEAERARMDNDILAAAALIASLEDAFSKAKMAYEERVLKVALDNANSLPAPFPPSVIDELKRWLERIKATIQQRRRHAARVGFDNWRTQVDARLSECQNVTTENTRPINRRRELRGLLESLRAKAVNTGLAEDETLANLYKEAYELLYSRPTPMALVEELVSDYLAAVR